MRQRTGPRRIRFHGQDLEFSQELRYLVADETAASVVGQTPRGRPPGEEDWRSAIATTLDLFDKAGRGIEGYEWLVTPNAKLDDHRPLELIQDGKGLEIVRETERLLAKFDA
jgi:hypothetical protein